MLTEIGIRNFQSLKKINLKLGKLTVIVGPSSSGKTAVFRALKVILNNSRTSSFITDGEKQATLMVSSPDGALAYARGSAGAAYTVALPGAEPAHYTKLGGGVPAAVSALLGVSTELSLAGQFDKPYLLDSSGAEIAKILGELTNVSVIFEAAKESNKRRLQVNATLKLREQDFATIVEKVQEFKDLPERIKKLAQAEDAYEAAQSLDARIVRLQILISEIELAQSALIKTEVVVPDARAIESAWARLSRFQELFLEIARQKRNASAWAQEEIEYSEELKQLEDELHSVLVNAGTCPLCGSEIKDAIS